MQVQDLREARESLTGQAQKLETEVSRLKTLYTDQVGVSETAYAQINKLNSDLTALQATHTDTIAYQREVSDDLRAEITELHALLEKAQSSIAPSGLHDESSSRALSTFERTRPSESENDQPRTPCASPPASPIKGTPHRNNNLESETIKGTLFHTQAKMLKQRRELEREKTLRLQLQADLRDKEEEITSLQQALGSLPSRRKQVPAQKQSKHVNRSRPTSFADGPITEEWEEVANDPTQSVSAPEHDNTSSRPLSNIESSEREIEHLEASTADSDFWNPALPPAHDRSALPGNVHDDMSTRSVSGLNMNNTLSQELGAFESEDEADQTTPVRKSVRVEAHTVGTQTSPPTVTGRIFEFIQERPGDVQEVDDEISPSDVTKSQDARAPVAVATKESILDLTKTTIETTRYSELIRHEAELFASRNAIKSLVNQPQDVISKSTLQKQAKDSESPFSPLSSLQQKSPVTKTTRDAKVNKTVMIPPIAPSSARDTLRSRSGSAIGGLNTERRRSPERVSPAKSAEAISNVNQISRSESQRSVSSLSSFASEIDERFNRINQAGQQDVGTSETAADPVTIESITKTMIGTYMYKYTRKPGRQEISDNRHKRYFWMHPYTRTLYWSVYNPVTAPEGAIIKSAPVLAIRIVADHNPMPAGIHRMSIYISTPKRTLKITAIDSHDHEDWVRALLFLNQGEGSPSNGGSPSKAWMNSVSSHSTRSRTITPEDTDETIRAKPAASRRGRANQSVSSRMSLLFRPPSSRSVLNLSQDDTEAAVIQPKASQLSLDDVANGMGLDNVRSCCGGQHDVSTLCKRSGRSRSSSRARSHCATPL